MAKKGKKKVDYKYNFKKYWSFVRRYKPLLFVVMFIILTIEVLRLVTKFLFKVVIDKGGEYTNGTLSRPDLIEVLIIVVIVFIIASLFNICAKWFYLHFINRLDSQLMMDLKRKMFNHIVHLSHEFHTTHKTGSMISRLLRGSGAIERLTDVFVFNFVPLLVQIVVVAGSIMYFSFIPAIVVIFVAALFIGYSLVINKFREESQVEANLREDVEKGTISDIFMNIDSIKYFGKEYRIKGRYHKLSKKTRDGWIKTWDYFRLLDAGHAFVLALGMFFIVYFPVMSFLNGEMTLGTLVFIEGTYVLFIGPLFGFVYGIRGFYQSMADMESIFYYSKLENDVKDSTHAKDLKIRRGEIEFRNVSFKYKRKWIFKNFNLKIPADKKFALVGPSGSGKSTLLKLLYRLYDIQKGEILIDGKNIKDFKQESLRSELSIVPQECVLFDDTIYNNIRFSRPGADRKEVFKAIKFAQLDKIIKNFEKKEKTIVGERGVKLSGGEKQRVSIARALLANKHVLVLDEATSALDSETEHEIQKDLEHLMKGRTSIIIAHRLSTIMKADSIVVLDKGKIVQQAKHGQLIRKPGLYKRLWNLQKGGYLK